MSYEPHPSFPPPSKSDAKIWRYMDFIKFFSLIRTGRLYFPSAWQLRQQDPFEGSFTAFQSKSQLVGEGTDRTWFAPRDKCPEGWDEEKWMLIMRLDEKKRKEIRKYMYISSWHLSEYENLAMWKLYDPSTNGPAIVSSFSRLRDSLVCHRKIHIGCVKYIDYHTDSSWLGIMTMHTSILSKVRWLDGSGSFQTHRWASRFSAISTCSLITSSSRRLHPVGWSSW